MSLYFKLQHIRHLIFVFCSLLLLCACSSNDDDELAGLGHVQEMATSNHYINLSIVVSSGIESTTRATPAGGEKGDGYEAGTVRENLVKGVTLMLYADDAGINTINDETVINFIQYYDVELVPPVSNPGSIYDVKTDEAIYSTGDKLLANSGIDVSSKYHAIVVANQDLTQDVVPGQTTVSEVREKIANNIYKTTTNGLAVDAADFVMASEDDSMLDFAASENRVVVGNKTYFTFDNIRIERLAARVDFCTNGAVYNENFQGESGYVYNVSGSNDKFILTSITPFNLYNGEEYYIKHVNTGEEKIKYLADETTTSFVIDPKTGIKNGTNPDYYLNALANLVKDDNFETNAGVYRQTAKNLHANKNLSNSQYAAFAGIGNADNYILCYPKENTLQLASPLYYYATGVAVEGYYCVNNSETKEHRVYYGFLRHNAEPFDNADTHTIKMAKDLNPEDAGSQEYPMNFGVVRNNIYRISINRVESQGMTMQIEVKKWDKFTHKTIFM